MLLKHIPHSQADELVNPERPASRRSFVLTLSMDRMHFYINGKLFDEPGTETRIPLGSVEEWTIRNEDNRLQNLTSIKRSLPTGMLDRFWYG